MQDFHEVFLNNNKEICNHFLLYFVQDLSPELEGRIISSLSQADQDMSLFLDQREKSPNQVSKMNSHYS